MARTLKIEATLSAKHLSLLRAMVIDPRVTLDGAFKWVANHGYLVSRNAVWHYRQMIRQNDRALMLIGLTIADEADARRKLKRWARKLSGENLYAVAKYAGFIVACDRLSSKGVRRSI